MSITPDPEDARRVDFSYVTRLFQSFAVTSRGHHTVARIFRLKFCQEHPHTLPPSKFTRQNRSYGVDRVTISGEIREQAIERGSQYIIAKMTPMTACGSSCHSLLPGQT